MAYARLSRMRVLSGALPPFRAAMEEVIPLILRQPGCRCALNLMRGERAVLLTIWETGENARDYASHCFVTVVTRLALLIEGLPMPDEYEVVSGMPDPPWVLPGSGES